MRGESLDEDLFRTRREVYLARLSDGVKVLTAAADIQDDRICYEIAAGAMAGSVGPSSTERFGVIRLTTIFGTGSIKS